MNAGSAGSPAVCPAGSPFLSAFSNVCLWTACAYIGTQRPSCGNELRGRPRHLHLHPQALRPESAWRKRGLENPSLRAGFKNLMGFYSSCHCASLQCWVSGWHRRGNRCPSFEEVPCSARFLRVRFWGCWPELTAQIGARVPGTVLG